MLLVEEKKSYTFADDSGVDFTPFFKVAKRIDECLSLISYYNIFRNTSDMMRKEEELSELREEIKRIKKSLR